MCTCIDFRNKNKYFGRTLDLEYHYKEEIVITPIGFDFQFRNGYSFKSSHAVIGMATVLDDYPLYYEGSNDAGLSIAGLYFPGNAKYFSPEENRLNLAPFELIPYFLSRYGNIDEMSNDLNILNITNQSFRPDMPLSPLHWMISDGVKCKVIEQTGSGLAIYDNPAFVMTNNPTFNVQLKELERIKNMIPDYKDPEQNMKDVDFQCVGYGASGLPGDYTSTSRFLKAVYLNKFAQRRESEEENVTQFFHILDQVSMTRGAVLTKNKALDMTVYSCCCNVTEGIYYFKTYDNNRIRAVRLTNENMNKKVLTRFPLTDKQDILFIN